MNQDSEYMGQINKLVSYCLEEMIQNDEQSNPYKIYEDYLRSYLFPRMEKIRDGIVISHTLQHNTFFYYGKKYNKYITDQSTIYNYLNKKEVYNLTTPHKIWWMGLSKEWIKKTGELFNYSKHAQIQKERENQYDLISENILLPQEVIDYIFYYVW